MKSYGQYCPIARASEVLAERWTPLIVRNLMFGADTFNQLAKGVPAMSRSMLVKRLGELERAQIVTRTAKPDGRGHIYGLTPAGADLATVIGDLAAWGERWVEVTMEHADPGFALWAWCQVQLDRSRLPTERVVISFVFPDQPAGNRFYWLLIENGDAAVCYSDPGGGIDVTVEAGSVPFVQWHRGQLAWSQAVGSGDVAISGRRDLIRAFPTWNLHVPVLPSAAPR